MSGAVSALSAARLRRPWRPGPETTPWLPVWSQAAAIRAVRAAVVMPGLFVIADQVIGNLQMALFAAFGSFATLVLASFAGSARDKLIAHSMLVVTGSVLLILGTAVNSSTLLAALVTVPVVFVVTFAGVVGPNAASGATAALLLYVLPAASPGTIGMIPDRLAGWWLASVVGTAAVLLLPTPAPADRLRAALSKLATALAEELEAVLDGNPTDGALEASIAAEHDLLAQFHATPSRPTGLAVADEALAGAVELLEWCTSLIVDTVHEQGSLDEAENADRDLLATTASVLRQTASLFAGGHDRPDVDELDARRRHSLARVHELTPDSDDFRTRARIAFHANAIAVTVLAIGIDAVLATRLADDDWVEGQRRRLMGDGLLPAPEPRRLAWLSKYAGVAYRHATVRSVWFINSLRSAVALAVAVAVADLSNVQHGFWVVLGTLSVLRTNASSTGATALRALLGTAIGFVIGAALLLAIGSSGTALWVTLPIAVLIAAYAPGTAPFAIGQAAFTVTIAVLFNLLVPVGWKVGELRIEDVALGCAVSVLVGSLFWPRGVASVVGDDLADTYRTGAAYLSQAVAWVCGLRGEAPDTGAGSVTAGLRLDAALRAFLAEQGTKQLTNEELWRLVGGTLRLRLTAHAVAGLPRGCALDAAATRAIAEQRTNAVSGWYEQLAAQLAQPSRQRITALTAPPDDAAAEDGAESHRVIWLFEHLNHLTEHLGELVAPAQHLAETRRRPWWR